jgi:hypothetical protein
MIYELVNPSDAVTFEVVPDMTDNVVLMAVVVAALSPLYAAQDESGKTVVPMFACEDFDKWMADHGVPGVKAYLDAHILEVATVMESCLYGTIADRQIFDSAVAKMNEVQAVQFRNEWNDKKRSSLNDIGAACVRYAKQLRSRAVTRRDPQTITYVEG